MRNCLLVLALIVVSIFSTSSVFAEGFDESKRSERLGLSFYDGRPLYVASFTVPYVSGYGSGFDLYRVNSGDSLSNYGDFDSPTYSDCRCEYVRENGAIVQRLFFFYCVDDDGEPVLLGGDAGTSNFADLSFVKKAFASTTFKASAGDVGLSMFDGISERARQWIIAALIFAGGVFSVKYGFREMLRFAGSGLSSKASSLASSVSSYKREIDSKAEERENFAAFQRSYDAIRELASADAYATGEAYGLTFTSKIVQSNQILQESWSRLSEEDRKFLLEEARALAWQDDLIDEKERVYRKVAMETAFIDLDGVDVSDSFSNPYDDETSNDDVDDSEPIPRPGVAPFSYVALDDDEDDGLVFPGEALFNRSYSESVDDYDAANRALDEVYYDEEGGYFS